MSHGPCGHARPDLASSTASTRRPACRPYRAGVDVSVVALAAFGVGTAGNSVKAMPQFVRTAVRGRVAGLSGTAVWLGVSANVLWLCFGVAISDWLFVGLGIVQTLLTAATLARFLLITGWSHNARHAAVALPVWVGFVLLAANGSGLVLETLGAAVGVVIGAPQLVHLWRRRRVATDVSGVAQVEHVVVVAAQIGWTTYWLTQGHPVAALGAAWGGAARGMTLVLLAQQSRRAQGPRDRGALKPARRARRGRRPVVSHAGRREAEHVDR